MEKTRIEKDTLGEIDVPAHLAHGAQTERSKRNFAIGIEKMPYEVILAITLIKKACAQVNEELGLLTKDKSKLIQEAADEILKGDHAENFPLLVWQTGSGTQTNMNVNEVIANLAIKKSGGQMGSKKPIHPNDDVNHSQSSNDVFPTAMNLSALIMIKEKLLPALHILKNTLSDKAEAYKDIVKVGRTHLMDATPLTLGQEFSGYASQIEHGIKAVENSLPHLSEIALGGTAVGTGLNSPKGFGEKTAAKLSELTGLNLISAPNKFESLASNDTMVEVSGTLKRVACSYMKIANDIRLMGSGPRSGLGELVLPTNEPGSSIMPGKVNPTQAEAMTQVAVQVMGNDAAIGIAASLGNFELNVFKPVMIYNLIQSIRLLSDVAISFTEKCLIGLEPNLKKINEHMQRSLMLATALNEEIGYDKAAEIVKKAWSDDLSLKQAAMSLNLLTEEQFDRLINPSNMI